MPALPALQVYVKARLEGKGDSTIAAAFSWPIFEDEDFVLSERIDLKLAPLALGSHIDGIHLFCESIKSIKGFLCGTNTDKTPNGHITLLQSIGRHCRATAKYILLQDPP